MSWYPIAFLPPQIENPSGQPYSGAVLKAYRAGTNINIPMATDYTGVTTTNSMQLNAAGYPTLGGAIVIPHLQENYKLCLYPNQAAADADSGAIYSPDNIQIAPQANSSFVQYFDGNNAQTVFNLSQNFGTDENILMVFADSTALATKRAIRRPDEYTIVGNVLTMGDVVPAGTKNIIVFAPSQLLGAANNAAAAAATSEANALAYKNGALAAQTAAQNAQTATETVYDNFDDRYLGAKAADPTLDNDGNALLTGALYWNTTSNVMKVWSGALWAAAYVGAGGALMAANNFSDVPNKPTARTNLGVPTGTSGAVLPFLNGNNNWSGVQSFGSGVLQVANQNGGQIAGLRNVVDNGAMGFDQRREGNPGSGSAGQTVYMLDRWCAQRAGASNYTVQRGVNTALPGFPNSAVVKRSAGTNDVQPINFSQTIQNAHSYRFMNKYATISFWARAGANFSAASGNLGVQVSTGLGGTLQNLLSTGFTSQSNVISQNVVVTPGGSWQRYSITTAAPCSSGTTQLGLIFSYTPVGVAGANDYIEITGVQLEEGQVATDYEHRLVALELPMLQGFYEKSYDGGQVAGAVSTNGAIQWTSRAADQADRTNFFFKTNKYILPTITLYAPQSGTINSGRNIGAGTDFAMTANLIGVTSVSIAPGAANTAAGNRYAVHVVAEAEI